MMYDNQKGNYFILRNLFRIVKQIDFKELKKITQIEKDRFIDNAIIKTQSIFEYWKKQSQDPITIPRTSNKLLKEKKKNSSRNMEKPYFPTRFSKLAQSVTS